MNQKYTAWHSTWQMTLILITLINLTTTTQIHPMEEPTENESFLQSVSQLPPEIQNVIAVFAADKFFLVAHALLGHIAPIKSLTAKDNLVKVELYQDEEGYHRKTETWDTYTGELLSSKHNSYNSSIGRHSFVPSINCGRPLFGPRSPNQKKALPKKRYPLYFNLSPLEFNTKKAILTQMQNELTIPQSNLIRRAYHTTKAGITRMLYAFSEDGKIFLTFDKDVRIYLLKSLNIQLTTDDPYTYDCVVQ
jgi:hypothetical protein